MLKILLLDDRDEDALLINWQLEKSGIAFEFKHSADKKQFIKHLEEFRPDVILSDQNMPAYSGFEACRDMREWGYDLPFIMVTGSLTDDLADEMNEAGIDDFILKDRPARLGKAIINAYQKKKAEIERQVYHEEIVRNEKKFRALIENTQDAITMMDEDFRVTYRSPFTRRMVGFAVDEEPEMPAFDYIHPDDIEKMKEFMNRVLKTPGEALPITFRLRHKDGHYLLMEGTMTNLLNDNSIRSIVGNWRDVTEKKLAEEKIVKSEQRLRKAQQIAHLGSWEVDLLTNHVSWSDEVLRILGLASSQQIGTEEIALMDFIHPEDREFVENIFRNPGSIRHSTMYYRILRRDKSIRHIYSERIHEFNNKDLPVRIHGIMHDITEAREAELNLAKSEKRFRSLIENNFDVITLLDENLHTVYRSPSAERVTGWSNRERDDRDRLMDAHPEDAKILQETITYALANPGAPVKITFRIRHKKGHYIWVEGLVKNLMEDENVNAYLFNFHDITERKMAEEQLLESEMKYKMLFQNNQSIREEERANISREIHDELGQQLTGLKMDALWLANRTKPEDKISYDKLTTMMALVDETMKTVRRISTDLRPGILDDLGLVPALEWQSHEFETRTDIGCKFSVTGNDYTFEKNVSTGIFRVFQETLTNVARHSHATQVLVNAKFDNNHFVLDIRDNGSGFDTGRSKEKRTLGLIGMKERALMLGGVLNIDSHVGKGTTVILDVPRHAHA